MLHKQQPALFGNPKIGMLKTATISTLLMLGYSQQAAAHVEYYDLNQGAQISDLTAAGKTASTSQYGANPTVSGLSGLNTTSDRALNNTALWNAGNQVYTGVGTFSNAAANTTSQTYTGNQFYNSNTVSVNDVTDWGWGGGTWGTASHTSGTGTGLLEDTHKVDFFNFRVTQDSTVTITWNVDDGAGDYIDNGFSLYKGLASYQAHDAATDPLNPTSGLPPHKIQDPLDGSAPNNPGIADAQGIASDYRNTLTNTSAYLGQFNALGNWGDGNAAGNWSNLQFITSEHSALANTNGTGTSTTATDTLETLTIQLAAGNYTIAAAGALGSAFGNAGTYNLSNLHGVLTYNSVPAAAAVPVPGSVWLFGSAIVGLLGMRRRQGQ